MRRTNLVILHVIVWSIMWLVIAAMMYMVEYILFTYEKSTYLECLLDPFTIYSQVLIGSFVTCFLLEDKRKEFIV